MASRRSRQPGGFAAPPGFGERIGLDPRTHEPVADRMYYEGKISSEALVLERKPDIAAGKFSFVVPNPTRGVSARSRPPSCPRGGAFPTLSGRAARSDRGRFGLASASMAFVCRRSRSARPSIPHRYQPEGGTVRFLRLRKRRDQRVQCPRPAGGPGSFSSWSHDAGDARHAHKSELQTFDRRRAQPGRRVRQRVRVSVRELRAGSRRRSARRPCAATGAAALAVPPCMRREAGVPLAQPSVRVTEAECHPTPPRGSFVAVVGGGGCILRASVRPVDLNRYALRVGSRVDQVKRDVRAGVGE
jgi:hypothetical protein